LAAALASGTRRRLFVAAFNYDDNSICSSDSLLLLSILSLLLALPALPVPVFLRLLEAGG
jgi:hypothetical protein